MIIKKLVLVYLSFFSLHALASNKEINSIDPLRQENSSDILEDYQNAPLLPLLDTSKENRFQKMSHWNQYCKFCPKPKIDQQLKQELELLSSNYTEIDLSRELKAHPRRVFSYEVINDILSEREDDNAIIKDVEATVIATAKNFSLQTLNLANQRVGVKGAKSLLANDYLKHLNLSRNHLGDPAIREVVNVLIKNSHLEVLDLSWNDIGLYKDIDVVDYLIKIINGNSSLRVIDLSYNFLNKDKIERLEKEILRDVRVIISTQLDGSGNIFFEHSFQSSPKKIWCQKYCCTIL